MATRLAAVFSHPIQYFGPLFRHLAADPELVFKVFFRSARGVEGYFDAGFDRRLTWDLPLLAGYESEILPARASSPLQRVLGGDNPGIGVRLDDFRADVVWLHGYASATNLRALWWGRRRAVIFTGDSELLQPRAPATRALKRLLLPTLFRRVDAFVDYGERNRDYYRHYGVPEAKMIPGGYPLDIGRFRAARAALTGPERAALRLGYGLDPRATTIVWAGKFVPAKRPLDLIDAIAILSRGGPPGGGVQALFIGSGQLLGRMEQRVAEQGLGGRVRFTGFVNQTEMPRVLALGDLLVMSSEREPYGLAIPEAMAVSNAIVASDRVGCVGASGVARPQVNTLVYPCGDSAALAAAIATLAGDPARLAAMQQASRELAWLQDVSRVGPAMRVAAVRAHQGAASRVLRARRPR